MTSRSVYTAAVAATVCLFAAGCAASRSQSASVVPTMVAQEATKAAPATWLESATLCYVQAGGPTTPVLAAGPLDAGSSAAGAVAPVAFAGAESQAVTQAAAAAPVAASPVAVSQPAPVRLLAIRYPHPDGRRDVARAELIVADLALETQQKSSWRNRLERSIGGVMPGMAWGPGIRQAKGLDLPVSELQAFATTATQPAAESQAADAPAANDGALPPPVTFEVNDSRVAVGAAAKPQLDALAARVARDGKLIAYSGSASEVLTIGAGGR